MKLFCFRNNKHLGDRLGQTLVIILALSFLNSILFSEETPTRLKKQILIEDTRQLVEILENSHPDPYLKGGGKIAFHRRFQETLLQIPDDGLTLKEFFCHLLPLVASVGDGHTFLQRPWTTRSDSGVPFVFNIVEKSLYVEKVFEPGHQPFIGARLQAINDITFDNLLDKLKTLIGWDNEYQLLTYLCLFLNDQSLLDILIPGLTPDLPLKVEFIFPSGQKKTLGVLIKEKTTSSPVEAPSRITLPSTEKIDFAYDFLDPDRKTCLLRIDGMFSYRENFEFFRAMGASWVPFQAASVYKKFYQQNPPDDLDKLIAAIPSATETFRNLVVEMKKAGTEKLLIDLRKNSGGNSLMADILAYFIFDQEQIDKAIESYSIRKYSDLYFANYPNDSLEKINEGRKITLTRTDYGFANDPYFKNRLVPEADRQADLEKQLQMVPTFYSEYKSGLFRNHYRPLEIIIISSAQTYSSAFTLMAMFYKLGAKIVGVPSSQSGNCFGDVLMFQLKNTGIRGYVSHKLFVGFPDHPGLGQVLKPHRELTYEDLLRCHFDPNASILLALGKL